MPRTLTIAAAQLGPISRSESRKDVVARLLRLLRIAHARGCELVVFPECALTPFFAHWWIESEAELESYFEESLPGPDTRPLFEEAARLKIGFCLGYGELVREVGSACRAESSPARQAGPTPELDPARQAGPTQNARPRRFNSSILVERDGRVVGNYRKIHLPGHADHRPKNPFQNLERRYFEPGDLGFRVWPAFGGQVGMMICNDRRWPESYRVLGLQGCELVLMGFNTPRHYPEYSETDRLADFHHRLSLQAGAYQNGLWVVAAAKAGVEEGVEQIGGSMIVAPSGEVVAQSCTLGDELVIHDCDLDACWTYKEGVFPPRKRKVEHYGMLLEPRS